MAYSCKGTLHKKQHHEAHACV
jgi:hypothetical protein